ncbi:MAG TPA: hypothetical protein VGM59_15860 [Dongiaceae bacterium]|jgi:hypothetical protein
MILQVITIILAVFVVAVIFNMMRRTRRPANFEGNLRSKPSTMGLRARSRRMRRRPAIDRISERR